MVYFDAEVLQELGERLYAGLGASPDVARVVSESLVKSSLMGLDSHGVIRLTQYAKLLMSGVIRADAVCRVVKETPISVLVDAGRNFGCVSAREICDMVARKAEITGFGIGSSLRCEHVGRLGAYTQYLAEKGFAAFAAANGCSSGHFVVPWGGREGRLATNPLSYAFPASDHPIVMDMSTSMIAEGKIRSLMHQGKKLPPDCAVDREGNPITDPSDFYDSEDGHPVGLIMPFGGALGYKGFALALLAEIMGAAFAGVEVRDDLKDDYLNGFTVAALRVDLMTSREEFLKNMDRLARHVTQCPPAPGCSEVVLPGEYDFRCREERLKTGVPVAEATVGEWREFFARAGIACEDLLDKGVCEKLDGGNGA